MLYVFLIQIYSSPNEQHTKKPCKYAYDHTKGILLGLHSNLFPTDLKATTASIDYILGLALSDSLRSPTKSAGRAAQQLSTENQSNAATLPDVCL